MTGIKLKDNKLKQEFDSNYHGRAADCYQCGKCTAGCPMTYLMDFTASQVVRQVQLGNVDKLLKAGAIWNCVGCHTCATRCPQGVSVAEIMDTLRGMSYRKGINSKVENNTVIFHKTFLGLIKGLGRLSEPWLVAFYKLGSKQFFNDIGIGLKMGVKGKLNPIPHKIKKNDEIKRIFERCGL